VSEGKIQDAIRLALSDDGVCVWRNNCGTAEHWNGTTVQRVRYGLAPGSADLIGICGGRFIAIEVKTPTGRVSPDQATWLECVRRAGGFAAVVRSVEDARAAIVRARNGETS